MFSSFNTSSLSDQKEEPACLKSRIIIPSSSEEYTEIQCSIIQDLWQDVSFEINRPLALIDNALLFSPLDTAGCVSISSITVNNRATGEKVFQAKDFHSNNLVDFNEEVVRIPSRNNMDLFVAGSKALVNFRFSEQLPDCPLQVIIRVKAASGIKLHQDVLKAHLELNDWPTILQTRWPDPDFEYSLRVAFAEITMNRRDWTEAVRRWQDIVSLKGADTPYFVYERLKKAYLEQDSFAGASPQEEAVAGGIDKHEFLSFVHQNLKPEKYFEIGVQRGKSLALAECEAIGVDPMPMIEGALPGRCRVVTMTSDDYFAHSADEELTPGPDLVFIDGMHLFEYALRDFMHIERFASPWTLVVIDDIFPVHPAQAERRRNTRTWTGDVWKLYEILKTYRADLFLMPFDSAPTGILLVTALKPENRILWDNYQLIVKKYSTDIKPPDSILKRNDALKFQVSNIKDVLDILRSARRNCLQTEGIVNELVSV